MERQIVSRCVDHQPTIGIDGVVVIDLDWEMCQFAL